MVSIRQMTAADIEVVSQLDVLAFTAYVRQTGYNGYCDAEVGPSCEPLKFMRYYRALFLALQNVI